MDIILWLIFFIAIGVAVILLTLETLRDMFGIDKTVILFFLVIVWIIALAFFVLAVSSFFDRR